MAEHRHGEGLIDEALDREVRALLDVAPSPEFVARVRTRVAADQMGRRGWFAWWILAGTATIAIVIAAAIVVFDKRRPAAPVASSSERASVVSNLPPPVAEATAEEPHTMPQGARAVAAPSRVPRAPASERPSPEAEVLVSPTEAAGVRYLLTVLREGRINPDDIPRDQAVGDSEMPIDIIPIIVEPLSVAADLE